MQKKINFVLIIVFTILSLTIVYEIIYLNNLKNKNEGSGIALTKLTITDAIFDNLTNKLKRIKKIYLSGLLKELSITEKVEGKIVQIGPTKHVEKIVGNESIQYSFSILFSLENGETYGYVLTQAELSRVKAYLSTNGGEKQIDLDQIQPGDKVAAEYIVNYLKNPNDSLISLKLLKLPKM